MVQPQRVLFVTGKLAESALRRIVAEIAKMNGIEPQVAVLPISVAALLTTDWVQSHLPAPTNIDRVVLPGYCRGSLSPLQQALGASVERGPNDLNDLLEYMGSQTTPIPLDQYDIEIIAEINDAPRLQQSELLALANRYRADGADVIDLGCDPSGTWAVIGDTVKLLRDQGWRVSVDSFNVQEIAAATKAGAELVLSVNSTNIDATADWGCEVVAIPDTPSDMNSLDRTINRLNAQGVRFRVDPILEPIDFGFSQSLGRYLDVRKRYPVAEIMMGIGNLTELTEVDSAGINLVFLGFCQEQRIGSVLSTEVANWCRGCIRELDVARRIVFAAARANMLPKHISTDLVQLRDSRLRILGDAAIDELAVKITDRNYRIFTERGEIHVINGSMHLRGTDAFVLFKQIQRRDERLTPEHAFYLGYEMAKAVTALTLGKNYVQDQALRWGILTREKTE